MTNKRTREAILYTRTVVGMRKQAWLGDAHAHVWLGEAQLPRKRSKPSYAMKASLAHSMSHFRIAARKGHVSAQRWLEKLQDRQPLWRKVVETGTMHHPETKKVFALTRSVWFNADTLPTHDGVYEQKLDDVVVYALWMHGNWTDHRDDPEHLADEYIVGSLAKAHGKRFAWRGLANDPNPPYVTYVAPPCEFNTNFTFSGYVAHKEPMSPVVKIIHMTKTMRSKDGDFLTVCGYHAKLGDKLRLWNSGTQIKVLGGCQPTLCPACEKIACAPGIVKDRQPDRSVAKATGGKKDTDTSTMAITVAWPEPTRDPQLAEIEQPLRTAVQPVEPVSTSNEHLSYMGGIAYENSPTGSRVERFEFIDQENIQLTLYSKVDDLHIPDSRFNGIATKGWDGSFRTGWVMLQTPDGLTHPYGLSEFSFSILHHDSMMIKIEGMWTDYIEYPFLAILHRKSITRPTT